MGEGEADRGGEAEVTDGRTAVRSAVGEGAVRAKVLGVLAKPAV
ncbi:hypothetical protein [Streptomyces sp. NPDC001816]